MSTENDVPLGDGSRRHYEQQFGNRIRQINKGRGETPKSSGGSGWNGRAGCGGGAIAAFIIIRILIALARTSSSSSSHNYSTPDPPEFQQHQVEIEQLLKQLREKQPVLAPDGPAGKGVGLIQLLGKEDIPLLQGLCYRIHRESLQPGESPGKHILQLLEPGARALLIRSAEGKMLLPQEESDLLEALDDELHEDNFYDAASFRNVPGVATLRLLGENEGSLRFHRHLLEKCYPQQIVPFKKRDTLTEEDRARWKKQAQDDLVKAKAEDKRGK
jgi:hypothetical protein